MIEYDDAQAWAEYMWQQFITNRARKGYDNDGIQWNIFLK